MQNRTQKLYVTKNIYISQASHWLDNFFLLLHVQEVYDRGLSFFSLYKAHRDTLATLTTLKRTPGISPTAWPLRPNPATNTSSFSWNTHSIVSNSYYNSPGFHLTKIIYFNFSYLLSCFLIPERKIKSIPVLGQVQVHLNESSKIGLQNAKEI